MRFRVDRQGFHKGYHIEIGVDYIAGQRVPLIPVPSIRIDGIVQPRHNSLNRVLSHADPLTAMKNYMDAQLGMYPQKSNSD